MPGNLILGSRSRLLRVQGNATPGFDPSTLSIDGWWRASYAGAPWLPTPSAGPSGTNGNLVTAGADPAIAAPLNGFTPADFDGVNDLLSTTNGTLTFVAAATWSAAILFKADTAAADFGAGLRRANPALIAADNVEWGIFFASDGVSLNQTDGISSDERVVAASVGSWHLAQAKFTGGNLSLRVDSGAWSTLGGLSNGSFVAASLRVGKNQVFASFYDGQIASTLLSKTAFSDATFDDIKSYTNTRYGLAL